MAFFSFFSPFERNYGSSIYAQHEAIELGCQQVLWLYGENHQITEVGTMNLFLYWKNEDGGIVICSIKLFTWAASCDLIVSVNGIVVM